MAAKNLCCRTTSNEVTSKGGTNPDYCMYFNSKRKIICYL